MSGNSTIRATPQVGDSAAGAETPRKAHVRTFYDRFAASRDRWIDRSQNFHSTEWRYFRFMVPPGLRVLEVGCGTGRLLAALDPSRGVGIDISPKMIERARTNYPELEFHVGDVEDKAILSSIKGPFDVIVISDTVGFLEDCQETLSALQAVCTSQTRIIISYYNQLWRPLLWVAECVGLKMPEPEKNWLSIDDLKALLHLADYEVIKQDWRQVLPFSLLGVARWINAIIGSIPGLRRFSLRNYVIARTYRGRGLTKPSATVVIPCRNERGNIEAAVRRLPRFCPDLEIIFVEGHSRDGTYEECLRVQAAYPHLDIKVTRQDGAGKGDAVRKGFAMARGDILVILDADLTVPPETIPRFYDVLASGKGEFVNGTRLVYPMETGAMRFLNFLANRAFAVIFSSLLNHRFTDTLCGTKALTKAHYQRIDAGRAHFGDFDPFGDFDLIFGAAKLNLGFIEVPIRYADRTYGTTQISRFRHGWLLARMVVVAFRNLKMI